MRHHVCLMHRDELLEVPPGEGWELEWQGKRPIDGLPTYPVTPRYNRCVDEQTEFLTKDGWKQGSELFCHHELATRDGKGRMVWEKPIRLFAFDHDGEMVRIRGRYVDLCVTPNHRMLVKNAHGTDGWHFEMAEEVSRQRAFRIPASSMFADGARQEFFTLPPHKVIGSKRHGEVFPERQVPMDDWLEFLGYYLADGRSAGSARLCQERSGKAREAMLRCLERLGFDFSETQWGFALREPQVYHYLRDLVYRMKNMCRQN
jgi:replicative DNA helicase Mcm